MSPSRLAGVAFGAALCIVAARPAFADVIDGHWCFPDGRRISIQGPVIVTPGGSRTQGDYARHFFTYVAPQADPDAGQTVSMILVNEETVHLRIGTAASSPSAGPVQVWHRCGPPVG